MKNLSLRSYAKINLGLQVLNKRPDAFHNINTLFQKIDLYDTLEISISDKLEVNCNVDLGIEQEENLVFKAIKKFKDKVGIPQNFKVQINKNIPFGGGLGGGSSNAAYALRGIVELLDIKDAQKELMIVAQSIGSDVPFFLKDGSAVGKSRGEKLEYFENPLDLNVLLVNPGIHVNTGLAYSKLNRDDKLRRILDFRRIIERSKDNPSLLKEFIFNDFEKAVFEEHPTLYEIKNQLYDLGAELSLMSGSGSTMFALFDRDISDIDIQKEFHNYFTFKTRFIQ